MERVCGLVRDISDPMLIVSYVRLGRQHCTHKEEQRIPKMTVSNKPPVPNSIHLDQGDTSPIDAIIGTVFNTVWATSIDDTSCVCDHYVYGWNCKDPYGDSVLTCLKEVFKSDGHKSVAHIYQQASWPLTVSSFVKLKTFSKGDKDLQFRWAPPASWAFQWCLSSSSLSRGDVMASAWLDLQDRTGLAENVSH